MHVCLDLKKFYVRLHDLTPFKRKEKKRVLVISAPFNFKKEAGFPAGFCEDELLLMREKAAASRIGVADSDERLPLPPGVPLSASRNSSLALHGQPVSPVSSLAAGFTVPDLRL